MRTFWKNNQLHKARATCIIATWEYLVKSTKKIPNYLVDYISWSAPTELIEAWRVFDLSYIITKIDFSNYLSKLSNI